MPFVIPQKYDILEAQRYEVKKDYLPGLSAQKVIEQDPNFNSLSEKRRIKIISDLENEKIDFLLRSGKLTKKDLFLFFKKNNNIAITIWNLLR
jgi:hypothetical protein